MYVCVCNAITEGQIKNAIRDGANTMHQLRAELKVTTSCGTCADYVENCLQEALDREMSFSNLASV